MAIVRAFSAGPENKLSLFIQKPLWIEARSIITVGSRIVMTFATIRDAERPLRDEHAFIPNRPPVVAMGEAQRNHGGASILRDSLTNCFGYKANLEHSCEGPGCGESDQRRYRAGPVRAF